MVENSSDNYLSCEETQVMEKLRKKTQDLEGHYPTFQELLYCELDDRIGCSRPLLGGVGCQVRTMAGKDRSDTSDDSV